ncbi:hypothetical protein BP5796_06727 [Coleophoma crateriformis]|uniref:Uncharacterized protein n=1 Tax=Coleophoma crateriformis TaxID=565419 RepID=A0A3D8RPM7_9HELO|nr:hypothetical protein BP5796_06727 [Coleophoma crateriformis]
MSTPASILPSIQGKDPPAAALKSSDPPPTTSPTPEDPRDSDAHPAIPIISTTRASTMSLPPTAPAPNPINPSQPSSTVYLPTRTTPPHETAVFSKTVGKEAAPRPSFAPFFTLVHDSTTQNIFHPSRIHYIFSDDDESEVLAAACVRAVHQREAAEEDAEEGDDDMESSGSTYKGRAAARKGKDRQEREERVVIVDVNETGDGITKAVSLSEKWQILSSEIANAPTWEGETADEEDEEQGAKGMLLRIDGVAVPTAEDVVERGENSALVGEDQMQGLLEGFERKMRVLRKIVDSGGIEMDRGPSSSGEAIKAVMERAEDEDQEETALDDKGKGKEKEEA